jgi:hypothetical protein
MFESEGGFWHLAKHAVREANQTRSNGVDALPVQHTGLVEGQVLQGHIGASNRQVHRIGTK